MISRSTPGEHRLPRGRVAILAAGLLVAAACGAPAVAERPSTSPAPIPSPAAMATAIATATPVAAPTLGIPMLGTTPPAGLVLPTYFVTLTGSKNGAVGVLTTPASVCTLSVRSPSGVVTDYPARTVGADGTTAFSYPPVDGHGESIQTVRCTLGDQSQTAKAQVLLP